MPFAAFFVAFLLLLCIPDGSRKLAVCLLLVIGIGALMPGLMRNTVNSGIIHPSGTASLLGSHAALGYIIMGLLAFLLGVCVTVLLYRLRRREERQKQEDAEDGEL